MRIFLIFMLIAVAAVHAQTLSNDQIARVDFEQHLGAPVPVNAMFRDEAGRPVRLGQYFGQRPVVLALAYYECPNLCTVVLNGMLESLRNVRQDAGRDFEVVVVSINPRESSKLAADKRHTYTMRYGRPGTATGWHFLTGDEASIQQLADAIGYHYIYEPKSKQYAHPSGIVVLTPEGQISRYFMGIEFPPKDMRQALVDASQSRVGSLANRLLLLCFHYDPHSGRYTLAVTRLMQICGLGTVLALGVMIVRMARQGQHREETL